MAGVPHTKRWEFPIRNDARKTKENVVKMILSSLVYVTPIRLPFCMHTDETERERENLCKKKKNQNRS